MTDAVQKYVGILDELLAARARGPLSDDEEAAFVTALNDWRHEMTPEQEDQLEQLVDERIKRQQVSSALGSSVVVPLASGRSKGPLDLLHLPMQIERAKRVTIT